ncbi:LacI family transcriptional regulator [Floricoccus penangensis]|uniref:LacI family transcriptional regulator n=1 Tax=Floricoccus penangensis TaxID=1859475 RepID=A0A9Q5JHE2_9LACT|nr:LacI family DNA-binding transcriptional regulator [Floricoccus penangensis]OFI47557.1 LacI family transcriptional regulator [Floricoccus penangensis]
MAKLTDVAKLAGVSPTTVSRVINNYGYLSQKTIDKVHAAMQELNYQPNNLARSLQGKKTQLIGLIFPSLKNPFYAELIEYLEKKLFDREYKVIFCNSENNPEKEKYYLQMLAANQVDGIISSSHNLGIEEYERLNLPIVSFDRLLSPKITTVSSDNLAGGKLSAHALIERGAKNLAIISGASQSGSPSDFRTQGFMDVATAYDLPCKHLEIPSGTIISIKKNKIKKFIEENDFDGIACTDDLTAIYCEEYTDCPIIGYDGTELIQALHPELLTIVQPIEELAQVLVDVIIDKINGKETELEIILPIKLQQNI